MEEFFKLYDYTVDAFKKALPNGKIGGINVAGTRGAGAQKWLTAFVKHCFEETNYVTGKTGTPVDAILFHAKGWPHLVNGRVVMDMGPQLRDIETGFKFVASDPRIKDLPIIIGESDPEGCAACGMATNPENAYRNGTMYSSYTAASFAREYLLSDQYKVNFKGAVSWSFEFENQPWFYGFRDLATNGVDKPVLNVFRMFGMMKGKRVAIESNCMYDLRKIVDSSVRGATDVGAMATTDQRSAAVMLWNYHDADSTGSSESIKLLIDGLESKKITLTEYRIDNTHSNSYEAWKKMGSPKQPTAEQIEQLQKAGQLEKLSEQVISKQTKATLEKPITLPRQGVSLIVLKW
jgi:xylan 1,4-beta-xylosidase